MMKTRDGDVLVVIDVQSDLFPGGAMPASAAPTIIDGLNQVLSLFPHVVFVKTWNEEGVEPPHCIRNTPGAMIHHHVQIPDEARIFLKQRGRASSALDAANLRRHLHGVDAQRLFLAGIGLEDSILLTAQAALADTYDVVIIDDLAVPMSGYARRTFEAALRTSVTVRRVTSASLTSG